MLTKRALIPTRSRRASRGRTPTSASRSRAAKLPRAGRAALESFRQKRGSRGRRPRPRRHAGPRPPAPALVAPASSPRCCSTTASHRRAPRDHRCRSAGCAEMSRLVDGVLAAVLSRPASSRSRPRPVTVGAIMGPVLSVLHPVAAVAGPALGSTAPSSSRSTPTHRSSARPSATSSPTPSRIHPARGEVPRPAWAARAAAPPSRSPTPRPASTGGRETIFDRYRQGSRGRAAGGAGLGLAIARGIAEAHHGTITVSSRGSSSAAPRIELPANGRFQALLGTPGEGALTKPGRPVESRSLSLRVFRGLCRGQSRIRRQAQPPANQAHPAACAVQAPSTHVKDVPRRPRPPRIRRPRKRPCTPRPCSSTERRAGRITLGASTASRLAAHLHKLG